MENQYRILSFDVGIKNLAFCVINFNRENGKFCNIEDWGLINLKSDLWIPDHNEKRCMAEIKNGSVCGKTSNCWINKDGKRKELCRVHSKNFEKDYFYTIKTEHNQINQNVEKLGFEYFPYELKDLRCYCGEKSRKFFCKIIAPESAGNSVSRISLENIKIAGFCNKCAKIYEKTYLEPLVKVSEYVKSDDTKLYTKLYEGLSSLKIADLNEVVIENQPALKNPRMKSIQMFIYSFFFINGRNGLIKGMESVGFFSATKKLNPTMIVENLVNREKKEGEVELEEEIEPLKTDKRDKKEKRKNWKKQNDKMCESEIEQELEDGQGSEENTEKDEIEGEATESAPTVSEYQAYKKRKNDSVAIVTKILEKMEEWRKYFISHPKKDDLADSLLQGIAQWCMHSVKKIEN